MAIPPQEVSAERVLESWADAESDEPATPDDRAVKPLHGPASLRIRQIEIAGFKSFRDRVVLRFPSGVTGIVGPNGCGKSNVVDAIRWVLGEQSAKRLRGAEMEDVIFAGGERQRPVGMAQVSIVFESDGLPTDQFALLKESGHPLSSAGPSEIMVTRRYLRSGESEYLMNGVPCRLRDITDLFLGTGLGGKAYAIIEQGRVERLVSAKPEEMRLFIEEAAGTTLYRSRRQVAERKMERTRENLARVLDILREVERQLAGLRRQAKRAEQFKALQAEIATLDLSLSARERARLLADLSALEERRAALQAREEELRHRQAALDGERRGVRDAEAAAQARIQEVQREAFEARAASESCRYEIARCEGRIAELGAQATAAERDLAAARAERAAARAERAAIEKELAAVDGAIARGEEALAQREATAARLTDDRLRVGAEVEERKVDLVAALTGEAGLRNAHASQERRRDDERARCARLEAAAAGLAGREVEAAARAEAAERILVETQGRLEDLEGSKRVRAEELRGALSERGSWDASLDGIKESLGRVRSRRDSLREIEDSHATYGDGVRAVLAASSSDEALALVAEVLEIPEDLERAVAAALGDALQAIVMRDHPAARDAVQALRRAGAGRATCMPAAGRARETMELPRGRRLLDLVGVRPGYEAVGEAVLGAVVLVDDLDAALAVWRPAQMPWTLVTRSGERVDPSGAITGGSEPSGETLLAQRRELRALDEDVSRREADLARAVRRQEELHALVAAREGALAEVDSELGRVTLAAVAAEKDVQRARHEADELREQGRAVAADLEDALAAVGAVADELARLGVELADAERRRAALERDVAAAESGRAEIDGALAVAHAEATEHRIGLARERARRDGLRQAIERIGRADDEAARRAGAIEERQRADARSLEESRAALAEAAGRAGALEEKATVAARGVEAARSAVAEARVAVEAVEQRAGEAQAELDRVRADAGAFDVQVAERRLAIGHLEETIRDRYQRELGEVEVEPSDEVEAQHERLIWLRERIGSMGEVNVAALGEVAELEERQRFLDGQRADLEQALEDLKRTIARLNRTSRTRFRETFDRVDATFQEVFPKLFVGGKAHLRLTDETQILESGVEIIVHLPGKRVGTLALLSGGEKALTAVSLIFALFLINPSPFCFLDEVDAPLDDANIGRFNEMVRGMSAHSQFILITHNKHTMEVAETLYGITMQEPGVSEVVSVRLPA